MKTFGLIVLLGSLALGIYALAVYDPSVSTGYGSVYNMGRLQDRQNMLIVAAVGAGIGTLLLLFGKSSERNPAQDQFAAVLEMGNLEVMEQLIDSGVIDPNGRAPGNMQSWLRLAVLHEGASQCELLLRKGADPALPDGFGTKVVDYVRQEKSRSSALERINALFENPPQLDLPPVPKKAESPPSVAEAASPSHSIADELAGLARLRDSGALTADEFERAKAKVLG